MEQINRLLSEDDDCSTAAAGEVAVEIIGLDMDALACAHVTPQAERLMINGD